MARKSLSTQVIEELDRARGILGSLQDSSDPIPGILIGTALESLNRIEGMCLRARQADVNAVLADPPAPEVMTRATAPAGGPTTHKRTKRGAPAQLRGERR